MSCNATRPTRGGGLDDAAIWSGEVEHDRAGLVVAQVGDPDHDGYVDIGVAAPSRSVEDYAGARGEPAFYLIRGSISPRNASLTDADGVWFGTTSDGVESVAVAGAGDVDGDCIDDVLVGVVALAPVGASSKTLASSHRQPERTLECT